MDEIANLKRPDIGESDEDLLKLQENFLRDKSTPSVKIVKLQKEKGTATLNEDESSDVKDANEKNDPDKKILHDIVENVTCVKEIVFPKATNIAFPLVEKIKVPYSQGKKGVSLFAQRKLKETKAIHNISDINVGAAGSSSQVLNDDKVGISEENKVKLSKMPESEILAEQQRLMQTLDPKLLAFIKSKKRLDNTSNITKHKSSDQSVELKRKLAPTKGNEGKLHAEGQNEAMEVVEDSESTVQDSSKSIKRVRFGKSTDGKNLDANLTKSLEEMNIPTGKWLHMDNVEKEKLQWLTDATGSEDKNANMPNVARFDFEGKLLAADADVDSKEGLHHHAEEPNRAGYSIEEIFMMTRSTTIPQRVLGLQILGRILHNNSCGMFASCFDHNLLSNLLSAGVVPLLRFSLDDSTETTISAAVYALKCLLFSQFDELCLDSTFNWHNGFQIPFLCQSESMTTKEIQEMTDEQILNVDVIQGLIRMDLIQRLAYVMRLMNSDHSVIGNIIQILIRVASHSISASLSIVKNKVLMMSLKSRVHGITSALSACNKNDVDVIHNCIKLLRKLAGSSPDIASVLVTDFEVMDVIIPILGNAGTIECQGSNALLQLNLETLRLWKVLLTYGLASSIFLDLYPVIMKHVLMFSSLSLDCESGNYDYDYCATLMSTLENVVTLAFDLESNGLDESHVNGLLSPLETCLRKWLWLNAQESNRMLDQSSVMIAKCLDLINTFFIHFQLQETHHSYLKDLSLIINEALQLFITSKSFSTLLNRLWEFSEIMADFSKEMDQPTSLVSLGNVFGRMDSSPILWKGTPFPLLTSISSLVFTLASSKFHKNQDLASLLLNNSIIRKYLRDITKQKPMSFHWCKRFELNFVFFLLKMSTLLGSLQHLDLYYEASLAVIPHIQNGDEKLASLLVSSVVFNPQMIKLLCEEKNKLVENDDSCDVLRTMLDALENIKHLYLEVMAPEQTDKMKIGGVRPVSIAKPHETIFPADWIYLPLVHIYNKIFDISKKSAVERANDREVSGIRHCLLWIFFVTQNAFDVIRNISFASHYCRLSCVFLSGNDVFMNLEIQKALKFTLSQMVQMSSECDLKFDKEIPGVTSFSSFYEELLIQYEAVSYGNELFSSFIMVPLLQRGRKDLKISLWNQHNDALRTLSLTNFKLFLPAKDYLYPFETDSSVLRCFLSSLVSGLLKGHSSNIIYLIAIHHLHHFLKQTTDELDEEGKQLHIALLNYISANPNSCAVKNLLGYDGPDLENITLKLKAAAISE